MRKSEIISLRWPNVDLENNIITIAATNSKSKRIKRIPTNSLRTCFELARKKSKVEDLRFHDLRHTAPTRMVEAGGNIIAVSKILGHADLRTTMRYAHPDNSLKETVEKLGNFKSNCRKENVCLNWNL